MLSTKKLTILAVLGLLSLVSMKSFAQKIGVVDGSDVLANYPDTKAADEKIKAAGKVWQDSITMMTKALQDKAENYKKGFETMSKDAQAKAQADVDKSQQDIYAYQNAKFNQQDGEVVKMRNDLLKPILDKIKGVITTVAKKKKIEIVLDSKSQAIYVADSVTDITEEVKKDLK
jgi:Skp family chaperone for outer membrane proteins